jgi:two-component sensor histidine kinase
MAGEADLYAQNLLSRRVTALRGIKEFLTHSSRMDPVSATAYSSALNATLTASAPPPPHR